MATSVASYLTGNRVYNGTSNAPNTGTSNPSGYVERELNAERRSGLAATMLANLRRVRAPQPSGQTNTNTALNFAHNLTIQKSPTGKLTAVPAPPADNTLPYDSAVASAQRNLLGQRDTAFGNINRQKQLLDSSHADALHQIDEQAPGAYRSVLNNYAARGMSHSSGYGDAYANTARSILNAKNQADQTYQGGVSDLDSQQAQYNMQYQQGLADLAMQQAAAAAQQAGNLYLQGPQQPAAPVQPAAPAPGAHFTSTAQRLRDALTRLR